MAEDTATATTEVTTDTTNDTGAGEGGQTATSNDAGSGSILGGGEGEGEGGGSATSQTTDVPAWMHTLPDDLKGSATLSKFKGANADAVLHSLAQSYVQLESKIGANTVKVPGKNATDEEVAEYRKAVGVPESPDAYEMPTEGIPEGVEISDELATDFKAKAHELGLTPDQAAALYRWQAEKAGESMQSQHQQAEQARQDAEAELKKEFGQAFQEKLDLARKAIQRFGGEDFVSALNETGAGNDPRVVKAMAQIGQAIASDEVLGEGAGKTFGLSPAEAQARINEKQSDTEFMKKLGSRHEPGHEQAVQEWQRLHEALYPEQEA